MNEKRKLRKRAVIVTPPVVSSVECSYHKNKFTEKENYLLQANTKENNDNVNKITKSGIHQNRYNQRSEKRSIKQDFGSNCKSSQLKSSVLSNVENICTDKNLTANKKSTKKSLNVRILPVYKRNLHLLNPRKKRHCGDVYDISLEEDLTFDESHIVQRKIHASKDKLRKNNEKIKQHLSSKNLKLKKRKKPDSKISDRKLPLNFDEKSSKDPGPIDIDKLSVSQISFTDAKSYNNEMCVEQKSFSISFPNDTADEISSRDQGPVTDKLTVSQNLLTHKKRYDNDMYVEQKSYSISSPNDTIDVTLSKDQGLTETDKSNDKEICVEQSISSPNNSIDETMQCTFTDLQSFESEARNKMYLSNLVEEFENSFSLPKMTSTPDGGVSKNKRQMQKNKVISITDISVIPVDNRNPTILSSTPDSVCSRIEIQTQKNKLNSIPDNTNDHVRNTNCANSDLQTQNDIFPQTDKVVEEITLFESPTKEKNHSKLVSPKKTIQLNLFGDVLKTPSSSTSTESLEESVIMPKKAYTPDNVKVHLMRRKRPIAKAKKEPKKVKLPFSNFLYVG